MSKKLNEEETQEFFALLQQACDIAEWDIAFSNADGPVDGMIIGNSEYIVSVVDALEGEFQQHDITDQSNTGDGTLH